MEGARWLLVLLSAAALAGEIVEDHRGMAFLQEGHFLLTANTWTLSLDVDISRYIEAVAQLISDVQAALSEGKRGIVVPGDEQDELGRQFTLLTARILEREGQVVRVEASLIFEQLRQIGTTLTGNGRPRRGLLNLGGEALKFLFGTLDDEDLSLLNRRIDEMGAREEKLVHVAKLQATIINTTYSLARENERTLGKISNTTRALLTELESLKTEEEAGKRNVVARLAATFSVSSSLRVLETILAQTRAEINLFKQAWETTLDGRLSPYLLSPVDLHEALVSIAKGLPRGTRFPLSLDLERIYDFFALARVSHAVLPGKVRLFVEFPLQTGHDLFTLYRALPLPVRINGTAITVIIRPEAQYLAVSESHRRHFTMTRSELVDCKEGPVTVCPPRREVMEYPSTSCLYSVFSGLDARGACEARIRATSEAIFYRARLSNDWVYSLPEGGRVIQHCPRTGAAQNTTELHLSGTGIFHLPPMCSAYINGRILPSFSRKTSTVKTGGTPVYVPSSPELFRGFEGKLADLPSEEHKKSLLKKVLEAESTYRRTEGIPAAHLEEMLDAVRDLSTPSAFSSSEGVDFAAPRAYHIGGGTAATAIIIAVLGTAVWKCKSRRRRRAESRSPPPAGHREEDVEIALRERDDHAEATPHPTPRGAEPMAY